MKKISWMAVAAGLFLLTSCGCFNTEETDAEIKVQDSLAEIDRNESLDEADRLLREADSLDQLRQDSLAKANEAAGKK